MLEPVLDFEAAPDQRNDGTPPPPGLVPPTPKAGPSHRHQHPHLLDDPFAVLDDGRRDALRSGGQPPEPQPTTTGLVRAIWELRSQIQSLRADRDQDRRRVDSVDQTNLHLQTLQGDLGQQLGATIDRVAQLEEEWATWVEGGDAAREAGPDGGAGGGRARVPRSPPWKLMWKERWGRLPFPSVPKHTAGKDSVKSSVTELERQGPRAPEACSLRRWTLQVRTRLRIRSRSCWPRTG